MLKSFLAVAFVFSLTAQAETKKTDTAKSSMTKNVSVSALGLLSSAPTFYADFALNEKSTIGGSFAYTSYSSGANTATSYGLGAQYNYWLGEGKVFQDGWAASGVFQIASAKGSTGSSATGFSLSGLALYNWYWAGGFNVNAGGGLSYLNLDLNALGLSGLRVSGILPALAVNVGYAF